MAGGPDYRSEHALAPAWAERLGTFLRFRELVVYHWAKARLADRAFDAHGIDWAERFLRRSRASFQQPLRLR